MTNEVCLFACCVAFLAGILTVVGLVYYANPKEGERK